MDALIAELSKPEYSELSDQQAADAINAMTVKTRQLVHCSEIIRHATIYGYRHKLTKAASNDAHPCQGLAIDILAYIDSSKTQAVDMHGLSLTNDLVYEIRKHMRDAGLTFAVFQGGHYVERSPDHPVQPMLRTVFLHGALADEFADPIGRVWHGRIIGAVFLQGKFSHAFVNHAGRHIGQFLYAMAHRGLTDVRSAGEIVGQYVCAPQVEPMHSVDLCGTVQYPAGFGVTHHGVYPCSIP